LASRGWLRVYSTIGDGFCGVWSNIAATATGSLMLAIGITAIPPVMNASARVWGNFPL
jgi:hypothetical protein